MIPNLNLLIVLFFPMLHNYYTHQCHLSIMQRITADAALNHGWFNEVPLPKSREFMPTFPPQYAKIR